MDLGINTKYKLEIINAKTGIVKNTIDFHNLITKTIINTGFKSGGGILTIQIGDGVGTPTENDSKLFNKLTQYSSSHTNDIIEWNLGFTSSQFICTILENELNGKYIREVGLSTSIDVFCTHAMLPIPILKTEFDIIRITITIKTSFDTCLSALGGTVKYLELSAPGINWFRFDINNYNEFRGEGLSLNYTLLSDVTATSKIESSNLHTVKGRFSSVTNNLNNSITGIEKIWARGGFVMYPVCSEWFRGTEVFDELLIVDGVKKDFNTKYGLVETLGLTREDGSVIPESNYTVELMKLKPNTTDLSYFLLPRESNTFDHVKSFIRQYVSIGQGVYQKFYNPAYRYGVDKLLVRGNCRVEGFIESEQRWYVIGSYNFTSETEIIIEEKLRNCSVWKITQLTTGSIQVKPISEAHADAPCIHFKNPPSAGEKIYANYRTKYIAKTANNTYDLTQTFTFGQGQGSNPQIDITELFVNPTSVDLKVGETVVLEVSYKPADAVNDITYTSDNPLVAVFEQGAIRAISVGTCTCKVKSKNVYQDILVTVKEII